MSARPTVHLLLPQGFEARTGGYLYDRAIVAELRALGWPVDVHELAGDFPAPDAAAQANAAAVLAAIPDGAPVVLDGLALGVLPEPVAAHQQRLCLIGLVHHPLALETGLSPAHAAALRESERRALAAMRRVIVTSPTTARALDDYGVPAAHCRVVLPGTRRPELPMSPPSVSDDRALGGVTGSPGTPPGGAITPPPSLSRDLAAEGPLLLCVATLTPRKGHHLLFAALADLQDRPWRLDCVGSTDRDPATTAALRQQLAALDLTARVRFVGELDEPALAAAYAGADVFVLPSYYEGYCMACAEALVHGLPIVTTTGGALAETVPGSAGLRVAPGDVGALRSALAQVLDDAMLRAQLAAGAAAAGRVLPDWPASGRAFAEIIEEALRA